MVENIKAGLIEALPQEAEAFEQNAQAYLVELDDLHERTLDMVAHLESKTIVSGGHFAFGHFIDRYGLEYKSPYIGFAPDAEPTPKRIAELIDFINDAHVRAIFYEELVDPRVATVISDETDAKMLMLHAAHNVSKDALNDGITYIEIMNTNIENIKQGLGYKEGE
jgi:zinc transport system substrate-binding protein